MHPAPIGGIGALVFFLQRIAPHDAQIGRVFADEGDVVLRHEVAALAEPFQYVLCRGYESTPLPKLSLMLTRP